MVVLRVVYSAVGVDFAMLRSFKNIHSGEIFDMAVFGQHVYTVSTGDDYMCRI